LLCEVPTGRLVNPEADRIKQELLKAGFREPHAHPFQTTPLNIMNSERAVIDHGWLRGLDYMTWINRHFRDCEREGADLSPVVVPADTEKRILRYPFPRRGARTIRIRHADLPGALQALCRVLHSCGLNVLSGLLRRGGQKEGYAQLVAVCEPEPGKD